MEYVLFIPLIITLIPTHIEYKIVCDENFFEHLNLKRLVTDDKIPFPMSTFERMIRYIGYGYRPCRETKVKIATAIVWTVLDKPRFVHNHHNIILEQIIHALRLYCFRAIGSNHFSLRLYWRSWAMKI